MSNSHSRRSKSVFPLLQRPFRRVSAEAAYFAVRRCVPHVSNPLHGSLEGEIAEGGERIASLPG